MTELDGGAIARVRLEEVARIGPYFAVGHGAAPAGAGWRPASALVADRRIVGSLIDDVAVKLGTSDRWIAASIFYQGWAARLTAIYAGSAALCGVVPDLRADLISYRLPTSGLVDMNISTLVPLAARPGWRSLQDRHLGPLAATIRHEVRIGSYLLLGNVGSALAGALAAIAGAHGEPLAELVHRSWAQPVDIAGSGRWMRTPAGPHYARLTCCGYERLDRGGRCADCSLNW